MALTVLSEDMGTFLTRVISSKKYTFSTKHSGRLVRGAFCLPPIKSVTIDNGKFDLRELYERYYF